MTELEKAYLAGIIDGEGSIVGQAGSLSASVSISQKSPKLLEWVKEKTGLGHICYSRPDRYGSSQGQWEVTGKEAVTVILRLVRPYILLKKVEVDIALTLVQMLRARGRSTPQGERELRAVLVAGLHARSSRGRRESVASAEE